MLEKIDPFWSDFTDWVKEKSIYSSQMDAKFDISGTPDRRIGQLRIILAGRSCAFRQYLSAIFAVFSLLFIALVGCNSGDGIPVQGESNELRYDSPKDFWLANPVCNEYTDGMKAYVQDVYPYTCVRHNNEWLWTKVCEHNGIVHIDGESWFEGENCSKMMYQCDDGFLSEYLGHSPSCGFVLSSNSTDYKYPNLSNVGSSSSSTYSENSPFSSSSLSPTTNISSSSFTQTMSYGILVDARDGQSYKTVKIGEQTWMAENLNYEYPANSYEDRNFCFGNEPANCPKYGRFYKDGVVNRVCPDDWHLPSENEWLDLLMSGESVKELRSTEGWLNGMNGSNVYGFSALPGGDNVYRGSSGDEAFENEGENACFWSSTLNTGGKTVVCVTRWDTYIFLVADKYHGYTVRCVKD